MHSGDFCLLEVKSINAANLGAQAIFSFRFYSLFAKTLFVRFLLSIGAKFIYGGLRQFAYTTRTRARFYDFHSCSKREIALDLPTRI